MNPKSQNISRILKITKHFVKESNFNQNLFKNNETFYYDQLFNLYSKNAPKRLYFKHNKVSFSNSISSHLYSPGQRQTNSIQSSRSIKMPMLPNSMSAPDLNLTRNNNSNNKEKRQQLIQKVFLLSYNSDFFPNKKNQLFSNKSVRIINDFLFNARDDTEYQTLHYEEEKIFHNKSLTSQRMKDSLNKIIEFYHNYKSSFENISDYYISKTINVNTQNEVNFKLTSVIIKMTNIAHPNIQYEYKLPLFFVPLFYYNPCNNLPTLLLGLINFNNKSRSISYIQGATFLTVINSLYHSLLESNNTESEKIRKYHEFLYYWITPTDNFKLELTMPLLTVTFKKTNTIIHKFIESKLFLYLHDTNFSHWTFYVVHYLYSFKNFRTVVDGISSKMSSSYIKYAGKDIVISEKRIKMNSKESAQLTYFLSSEEGKNYTLTIDSMYIEVTLNNQQNRSVNKIGNIQKTSSKKLHQMFRNSNSSCNYKFVFSFREMKPLLKVHLYSNLLDFLSKFVTVNTSSKNIEFNYRELNNFPIQMLKNFSTQQNYNQDSIKMFNNFIAKVVNPVFSIKGIDELGGLSNYIKIENGDVIRLKEFEMNTEAIDMLLRSRNIISDLDLIRKLLFYLESEYDKNEMLSVDGHTRRLSTRRRFTVRRRTRIIRSMSLNSFGD